MASANSFNVPEYLLKDAGDKVFQRYDTNRNGKVPTSMVGRMVSEWCYLCGTQAPADANSDYYVRIFDPTKDGNVTYYEWLRGLKMFAGYDTTNLDQLIKAQNPQPQQPVYYQQQQPTYIMAPQPTTTIIHQRPVNTGMDGATLGLLGAGALLGLGLGGGHHHHGWGHHHHGWGHHHHGGGWW